MKKHEIIAIIGFSCVLIAVQSKAMDQQEALKEELLKRLEGISQKKEQFYDRNRDIKKFEKGIENKRKILDMYKRALGERAVQESKKKLRNNFEKYYFFLCSKKKNAREVKEKYFQKYPIKEYSRSSLKQELLNVYRSLILIHTAILKKEIIPPKYKRHRVANRLEVAKRIGPLGKNMEGIEKKIEDARQNLDCEELFQRVEESKYRIQKDFDEIVKKEKVCNEFKFLRLVQEDLESKYIESKKENQRELYKILKHLN